MATENDILQLLRDYRPFHSAYGGARPLDETHVSEASYGPAGLVTTGAAFEKGDVEKLKESYRKLNAALRILRRDSFPLWVPLVEPYLADPADPGVVEDWRRKIAELDAENEQIRKHNEEALRVARKKGKRPPPPELEKVRFVTTRMLLERHDAAIKELARLLEGVDLHVVNPRLMSTREEAAGDAANAQIYAYFQQVRASGRTERGAVSATAWKFGISEDEVERIIEFRADVKLATCAEPDCGNPVFSQNLCQKHYQRQWRRKTKGTKDEGLAS